MTVEAWIIDELEEEQRREDDVRPRPELDPPLPVDNASEPSCGSPSRGVRVLDISPTHDNEIDL